MTHEKSKKIGQILMSEVRDATIDTLLRSKNGEMTSSRAQLIGSYLRNEIVSSNYDEIEALALITDNVIFQLLVALEANSEELEINFGGEAIDDISDGLAGELWGEHGWIASYSKFKAYH